MKTETIRESHFDFRDYSNFDGRSISRSKVNAFFEHMPKDLLKMIEKEFAKNKKLWEKDREKYFKNSMRNGSDNFWARHGVYEESWFRKYVPYTIRKYFYAVEKWYDYVFEEKVAEWYYPIDEKWSEIKQFFVDRYTKWKMNYVAYDIWNFDFNIAKLLVPRLIAVKKMKRHSYIRNEEASEAKRAANPNPESYEDNEVYYTDEEWADIMDKIIFGFMIEESDAFDFNDSQFSLPNESYWKIILAINEVQKEGRLLFAKHFYQFGD